MRSARHVVRALLLAAVLLVAGAGTTSALALPAAAPCVYVPTCTPTLAVVAPLIAAGATQTAVGSGFAPGDTVTVTVTLSDGSTIVLTATADATGSFTVTFSVPDALGAATLTAVGARSGSAGADMTVVTGGISGSDGPTATDGAGGGDGGNGAGGGGSGAGTTGGGLAFTGVAVAGTGGLAVLLLVGGVTLLVLGRRRPTPGRHVPRTP